MGINETSDGSSSEGMTESTNHKSSGLEHAIVGALLGATAFVTGLVSEPVFSILLSGQGPEGQIDARFSYAALALVVLGLSILFISLTAILTVGFRINTSENPVSVFSTLCKIFSKGHDLRIFLLSSVVYAIFYSFASGIVVYNPNANFSTIYHVSIPSSAIATCCSSLGQTPVAVFYLTNHLGLLLVPANLLLLFSISWLVGLNIAVGVFVLSLRVRSQRIGWLGAVAAFAGLFTSCPTCAGLAIFSILGGTSAVSAGLFLGPLQAMFVGFSIPILVASPILLARSLRGNGVEACPV